MIHIETKKGDLSPLVIVPGDPLRGEYIAKNFLSNVKKTNSIRNMFGFTGEYKGKKISIQATGMGVPSISIYLNELIMLGAKKIIRIGTCGTISDSVNLRELIIVQSAATDSSFNKIRFNNEIDYPATPSFELLLKAYNTASALKFKTIISSVLTSDTFYYETDMSSRFKLWEKYGITAIEMETAALYTVSKGAAVESLSILSVTDHIIKKDSLSPQERVDSLNEMITLSLETI
ncbi:purine-nucleoside phosphorylase [bacterium]|nr:purine-nucleoside phosphorylase [bacterium]